MRSLHVLLIVTLMGFISESLTQIRADLPSMNESGRNCDASRIDDLFQAYNQPSVAGASVLVIKDGKVLFKKAYGLANLETKTPSSTRTNYRLASMTKQFTAMAIMVLAERKKLSYDDRLTKFFPDFPAYGQQITLRHLLNHTSGLIEYSELIPKGTTTPLTDRDVLDMMKKQDRTYFSPGSQFRYSNSGYTLLGLIVEVASGVSFPESLRTNIFKPLGMTNSKFYRREDSTDAKRAYGYTQKESGFEKTDQSLTSSTLADGSVYSSVEDLFRWEQALYSTRLVSSETLNRAFSVGATTDDSKLGYGFGWFIGNYRGLKTIYHGGNTIGFTSVIRRFPEQKFGVIVLTNRNSASLGEIVNKIEDMYLFDCK